MSFFEQTYLGNTVLSWIQALAVFLVITIVLSILKRVLHRRIAVPAAEEVLNWADLAFSIIQRTSLLFILMLGVYAGALTLELSEQIRDGQQLTGLIIVLFQVGLWGMGVIDYFVRRQVQEKVDSDAGEATTLNVLGLVANIGLWVIIVLLILDNLPGVEIDTLIASLGIGGVAVALAVQNILGDLFASLSIALDKPFAIGDFLVIDDFLGNVEYIGLKSTRIRSLSGEQLVFSNSDLLNSRLRNFKRMDRRRVIFTVGVTYQTPPDALEAVPAAVQHIVDENELTTFDRCHFKEYGDSALNFEVVFYVESADYNIYMDIREEVNLAIFRRFHEMGLEFAYPTRTVFVEQ